MPDDERLTWGFILEVLEVMERHGYRRSDNQCTGQAIGLIRDAARVYEGTLDAPLSAYIAVPQSPPACQSPGLVGQDAVVVSSDQVKTLLAALDEAASYKRDRAAACAGCADRSCDTCQWWLQAARDYERVATQMVQAGEAVPAAQQPRPDRAQPARGQPQAAADPEAGQ